MSGSVGAGEGGAHRPVSSGAALRDELPRQERRRRRAELPTIIGLLAVGLLIALAGRDELGGAIAGVWIFGLGVLFLLARSARSATRRPLPAPNVAVVRGTAGTAIPADARPDRLAVAIPAWTALALAAVSAVLLAESASSGYLTAAGAVGFVAVGLRMLLRARRPGLWMTTETLSVRDARGSFTTPWADVRDVVAPSNVTGAVMLRLAAVHPGFAATTASAVSLVPIRTDRLPGGGPAVARIVAHFRDPVSARELGTEASLATVARLLDLH